MVESRIDKVFNDLTQLTEKNHASTSSGTRVELWKSGVYAFTSKPIFGVGYQDRQNFKKQLVDNNQVDKVVLRYSRLHNSFIEELSVKGIIGFTASMIFFNTFLFISSSRKY